MSNATASTTEITDLPIVGAWSDQSYAPDIVVRKRYRVSLRHFTVHNKIAAATGRVVNIDE